MQTLSDAMLHSIRGGQAADGCSVTNNAEFPLAMYPNDEIAKKFMIAPGATGTVPSGSFGVVAHAPGGGAAGARCIPGRSFSATRDDRFPWANVPNVLPQ
jgi:hypothetical protein